MKLNQRKVFIFWDNSNIFISAKAVANKIEGPQATNQVRVSFHNLLYLARANRETEYALAVGSIPPELEDVWGKLEQSGVRIELFERGTGSGKEQAVDEAMQVQMLRKALDYKDAPGTVVLLTGDGQGFLDGVGFHADLERMHKNGWHIEVLAWESSCNKRMKEWAQKIGVFIPLESFYDSVTYLEDFGKVVRNTTKIDPSKRPITVN